MADEPSEAPVVDPQDTPAPPDEAPQEGTPSEEVPDAAAEPEIDFEKRYNDIRPHTTQVEQELAVWRERFGENPYELTLAEQEEAESEEDLTPEEKLDRRLAVIERDRQQEKQAHEEQEEQAAEQQMVDEYVESELQRLDKKLGRKFTAGEVKIIDSVARRYPVENGAPDVDGAFQAWSDEAEADRERYLESKKAPKVGVGSAGHKKFDPSNEDERLAAMREVMDSESEGPEQ